MEKKILVNYFYNLSYKILILILPFITTPYVSRVLGVTNLGIFNYTSSIVAYFVLFGTLGLNMYGQREIAYVSKDKKKCSQIFWQLFLLRALLMIISTILFLFVALNSNYCTYLLLFSFQLIANAFDIAWFFNGIEQFKTVTIRNFIIKIIGVICIFIFVKDSKDLSIYILCNVLILLAGNISLWFPIRKIITKERIKIKQLLTHLLPVFLIFIPQIIDSVYTMLDSVMLGKMSTMEQVGLYGQANKMIQMAVMIVTSLGLVVSPRMAHAFKKREQQRLIYYLKESFKFTFVITFLIIAGIISVSSNFSVWFFGSEFIGIEKLMIALSPTVFFLGVNSIIGWQYLLSVKKEKEFIFSVSIGALSNFIINIAFIPKFNALGAVIASNISMFLMTIINLMIIHKLINLVEFLLMLWKPLMSCIISVILVQVLPTFFDSFIETFVQGIICVVCYFSCLCLLKDSLTIKVINKMEINFKKKI